MRQNHYAWIFGMGIAKLPSGAKAVDPTEIYNVEALPTTVFIDRSGNIVDTVLGGMEKADFEERLAKIL